MRACERLSAFRAIARPKVNLPAALVAAAGVLLVSNGPAEARMGFGGSAFMMRPMAPSHSFGGPRGMMPPNSFGGPRGGETRPLGNSGRFSPMGGRSVDRPLGGNKSVDRPAGS